jgi:type IV secretion system protein VirB10
MKSSHLHPQWIRILILATGFGMPAWAQQTGSTPSPDQAASQKAPDQSASPQSAVVAPSSAPAAAAPTVLQNPKGLVRVASGTHIPMVLHNAITTRNAKIGDPVYFETLFPIMVDGHVVIPAGSYISGELTEVKRAGRVKGRAELMAKLNTLILPNGYMVNLNASPGGDAGTGGNEQMNSEGKIIGDSDKKTDVGTVVHTTVAGGAIGSGIGAASGNWGKGAGIGLGAGAAAGLLSVLLTRGPEAELPRGTTLEAVLDRPIMLDADKDQFTGPGQASSLAGPPNREPVRNKLPF